MLAVSVVAVIVVAVAGEIRLRHARRERDSLANLVAMSAGEVADAERERDAAVAERDSAIERVKYRPMRERDLERLSKTGCGSCHGAGVLSVGRERRVCACVSKKMAGNLRYGVGPDGWPLQLATREEVEIAGEQ